MVNKIWYLSTCDTCKRIINELDLKNKDFEFQDTDKSKISSIQNSNKNLFEFQDIKKEIISKEDLEEISNQTGLNYEELFNKRAQKYSKTSLKEELKSNEDFKKAILEEYTFMKRPIIKIENKYFVGNSKKVVEEAKSNL